MKTIESMFRFRSGGARGPGVFFVLPCIDNCSIVDLRTVSFDVPPQEVLTKDSVTVSVDAVVYYRISDPLKAVIQVNQIFHTNSSQNSYTSVARWRITVIQLACWLPQRCEMFWAPETYRNYWVREKLSRIQCKVRSMMPLIPGASKLSALKCAYYSWKYLTYSAAHSN